MQNPQAVSIETVPNEFNRVVRDVRRTIDIYKRKGVLGDVDPIELVRTYFYIENGQRFVIYDETLDLNSIKGKILTGYPKTVNYRSNVVNVPSIKPSSCEPVRIFDTFDEVALQAINIAPKGLVVDLALQVEGARVKVVQPLNGNVYCVEKCDTGIVDIMSGPDNIEKKPFSHRRQFLETHGLRVVPESKDLESSLLIKDLEPYVPGGTGGYFRYSRSDELCVERVVVANECSFYLRGSMTSANFRTRIHAEQVSEPESNRKVRINLLSNEVISEVDYVNDVVDYYNIRYSLPNSVGDIRFSREGLNNYLVCPVKLKLIGNVQGIGLRKRFNVLFFGSQVRLKISNVGRDVDIEGDVFHSLMDVFIYKTEALAFANKIQVKWILKGDSIIKHLQWNISIV